MNKEKSGLIAIVALVLSIAALVMCYICCQQQKKASAVVDAAAVEKALLEKPEMVIGALNAYEMQQRMIAERASAERIKPFMAEIIDETNTPAIANADGSITLVEFFDYSCGYCHRMSPILKEIAKKNPNVKVIVKPVAFLGPNSAYAARAALVAAEQGKFAEMNEALFAVEGALEEAAVDAAAANVGLDMDKYKAAMASSDTEAKLQNVTSLAQKAGVNGVPTFVLDGIMFNSGSEEDLQLRINAIK